MKMVQSMIRFHEADLIGVQEALEDQMDDLAQMLPDYAYHGVARDTGKWAEYSSIWYRKSRLEWLEGIDLLAISNAKHPKSRMGCCSEPALSPGPNFETGKQEKSFCISIPTLTIRGKQPGRKVQS